MFYFYKNVKISFDCNYLLSKISMLTYEAVKITKFWLANASCSHWWSKTVLPQICRSIVIDDIVCIGKPIQVVVIC